MGLDFYEGIFTELFNYQKVGVEWLYNKRFALLADGMGLGKSAQAIRAADIIKARRILVLCPAVARINWLREFTKFSNANRTFDVIHTRNHEININNSVICSYDLASEHDPVKFGEFDLAILDEAHYLKSIDAIRTQKVLGAHGYVRRSEKVWCLTGTPAPNNASELWPLLYTFGYTTLRYNQFVEKFCDLIKNTFSPNGGYRILGTKKESIPELRKILDPFMLRRKAEDVLKDLPEIFFSDLIVEPGPVELELLPSFCQYVMPIDRRDELKNKLEADQKLLDEITNRHGFSAQSMELLKGLATSVSTLRRYNGVQKVEAIAKIVKEELEFGAYDKIVIFAIHTDVIEGLRRNLSKFNPVTLYGKTPPEKRQKNIDKFQNNPRTRIFIGNIGAAGTAITLTAANQVLFAEQDWVPGNNMQAAKRCHRIGQSKPVFVRIVSLEDSFDEKINKVLRRKAEDLTQIFDKKVVETISSLK